MLEGSQSQPDKRSSRMFTKRSWVNPLLISLVSLGLIAILPVFGPSQFFKSKSWAEEPETQLQEAVSKQPSLFVEQEHPKAFFSFQKNTALPVSETFLLETEKPIKKIMVVVTGYSSTPWETDDTPYITASGTGVREGIVAANFLPFGTKVKIPEVYGEKIFVVEDRMHPRNYYHVDIWFSSYWQALNFGATITYVEILEG